MNIGNGFIADSRNAAIAEMSQLANNADIRKIKLPIISATVEYFISPDGVVFGCHKHHGFYLVTKLTIDKRYKAGPSFRISVAPHKEKSVRVAVALYNTFKSNDYNEDLELEYIDGNTYNIQLQNLKVKEKKVPVTLVNNLTLRTKEYCSSFDRVTNIILRYSFSLLSIDEAKDIAQDTFLEICANPFNEQFNFVAIWINRAKLRYRDKVAYNFKFDTLFYENGEERYSSKYETKYEVDFIKQVKGEKRKKYIRQWANGETPTAIAEMYGSTLSTVGAELSRTVKKLQGYYKKDIILWNK